MTLDLGVEHVRKNGLLRFVNSFRVPWLPLELVMPRVQPCRTQETCVHDSLGRSPYFLWYSKYSADAHTGTYWLGSWLGLIFPLFLGPQFLRPPSTEGREIILKGKLKPWVYMISACVPTCLATLGSSIHGCGSRPLAHCNLALDNSPTTWKLKNLQSGSEFSALF